MEKQIKQVMLKLLETDPEIIGAIQKVVNVGAADTEKDTNEKMYLSRIELLESECDDLRRQKQFIESEFLKQKKYSQEKDNELISLRDEFQKILQSKSNEMEEMKVRLTKLDNDKIHVMKKYDSFYLKYAEFENIFKKYISLGDDIFERTSRILNGEGEISSTPIILFAYGMQENNIVALWESIATNYDFFTEQGKINDLIDILSFFLDVYKAVSYKQIIIEWPEEGDVFDERVHTRTASSSAVGKVKKVILPGLSIGKNISKKALVIVE